MGPLGTSRCHHLPGRARWWITIRPQSCESHRKPMSHMSARSTSRLYRSHAVWRETIFSSNSEVFFHSHCQWKETRWMSMKSQCRCFCEHFVPEKFRLVRSCCVWSSGVPQSNVVILPVFNTFLPAKPFRRQQFHNGRNPPVVLNPHPTLLFFVNFSWLSATSAQDLVTPL